MINTKFKKIKGFILPMLGIFIIASLFALLVFWETSGRELYLYDDIVVLNTDVKRGDLIDESMLTTLKLENTKVIDEAIKDPTLILGKEARHFIPAKSPLHIYYFEEKELITDKSNLIFKIPNEWIYSAPSTMRRKDIAYFYEVSPKNIEMINDTIKNTTTESVNEDYINTFFPEEESFIKYSFKLEKPIAIAKIAYIKDSNNREVITTSRMDRLDGSSRISDIEIATDPIQFQKIKDSAAKGNKFIIMYEEGGILDEVKSN